jgi:hypothetical protein
MRNRKSDTILLDATAPLHIADVDVTVNLNLSSYPYSSASPISTSHPLVETTGDHTSASHQLKPPTGPAQTSTQLLDRESRLTAR